MSSLVKQQVDHQRVVDTKAEMEGSEKEGGSVLYKPLRGLRSQITRALCSNFGFRNKDIVEGSGQGAAVMIPSC